MTTHTTHRLGPPTHTDDQDVALTDPTPTTRPPEQAPDPALADDPRTGDGDATSHISSRRCRTPRIRVRMAVPPHRAALTFGLIALTAIAGLSGWLGYQLHREQKADQQYAMYLQTGRQGALNLTTIDWQHADSDLQRILDSATGTFHDDFAARANDFIDVVKQTQSHTEGSIGETGVESETPTSAKILVAVNVKSTQAPVALGEY